MIYLKPFKKVLLLFFIFIQGTLMSASLDFIEFNKIKIPFIYEEDKSLPIVEMKLVFKSAGSVYDNRLYGLANLTSLLLEEGSKKDGNFKFAKKLEEKAIELNIGVGKETFVFDISSLKEHFSFALQSLEELLIEPNFTDKTLAKIQIQILSTILAKETDYDFVASQNLKKMIFKDSQHLLHSSLGNKESIAKIQIQDVKNFTKQHLSLNNLVIVVGGDINKKEIIQNLENIFKLLPINNITKFDFVNINSNEKMKTVNKDTKQAYIYFASPLNLKIDSKDRYKMKIASFILGSSGFGSRLMEEIRVKRGLAYSAYSYTDTSSLYSYLGGYLQTKLTSKNEAIEVIKEVFAKFVKKGVTKKELESAKKFIVGSEPLRNEKLAQRLNRVFMEYFNDLKFGYHKQELKKIEKLSLEELNSFIKKHNEILDLSFSIVTSDKK